MAHSAAALEKGSAAERGIARVRLGVILFNAVAYALLPSPEGSIPWLAWSLILTSAAYALAVTWIDDAQRLRWSNAPWVYTTVDGLLIATWVLATGGFDSPFFVLWYGAIVTIAYRFRLRETLAMAGFYISTYIGVLLLAGELTPNLYDALVRSAYIGFVAWIGGLVGEEVLTQTQAKIDLRHLNAATEGVLDAKDLPTAIDRVINAALGLVRADAGAIFLGDEETETITEVHAVGLSDRFTSTVAAHLHELPAKALLDGDAQVHVQDLHRIDAPEPVKAIIEAEGVRTVAILPLHDEGKLIGGLALYRRSVQPFSSSELELMASLAGHAVIAFRNAAMLDRLTRSEARWRSLAENVPNFVVTVDPEGSIVFVNRTRDGVDPEVLVGQPIGAFTTPSEARRLNDALSKVLALGDPRQLEIQRPEEDGTTGWYNVHMARLPGGGSDDRVILVATDITEYKQLLEDLMRSNEDLQQFAYAASHDLKEPLRMVQSYVQLLERSLSDRLREDEAVYMGYATEGVQRMNALIDGLLSYARVDHATEPFQQVDLRDVLDRVLAELAMSIGESHARITHDEMPIVWGDDVQIAQVLRNLISNAIKFRDGDAPRIHVSARPDGDTWIISVEDDGIGIDPTYHGKLFTIFNRLHARDRYPGSGIGLAVSKRIVERHSGRIWLDSEPGQGSTFRFTLPGLHASGQGEATLPATPVPDPHARGNAL